MPVDFDVINITETLEQYDGFKGNVSIDGYDIYSTPTLTLKGGTCTFIKSNLEAYERQDLKICDEEFESVWVEIKNNRK